MDKNNSSHTTAQNSEIIQTPDMKFVLDKLQHCCPATTLFLDVDDTLITPASKIFRTRSPFRNLIDDLKKNKQNFSNFEEILGHWRLKRKSILVSELWPNAIQKMIAQGSKVYGLTQMDTGSLGPIASVEEWRCQELRSKDIRFCETFKNVKHHKLIESPQGTPAIFYHGVFMTGSFSKNDLVSVYLKNSEEKPAKIILVDDREFQVLELAKLCNAQKIPYLGIIFRGVDELSELPNPHVAEYQIQNLLNFLEWLEDEEAEERLQRS